MDLAAVLIGRGGQMCEFAHLRRPMPQHDGLEGGVPAFCPRRFMDQPCQRLDESLLGRRVGRRPGGQRQAGLFHRDGKRGRRTAVQHRCHLGQRLGNTVAAGDGAQDVIQQRRGGRQGHWRRFRVGNVQQCRMASIPPDCKLNK
ncbi:hypothetical protein G6F65_020086 [Rhizopus arrhizus]|nr:hypothetical protein G6F65_020086 [Rhizopus arrhizus]